MSKSIRPYQEECILRTDEALEYHKSVLVVMATGTGKSCVAASFMRKKRDNRFLFFAHRKELITQTANTILSWTGERASVEMASWSGSSRSRIVVASVQTISKDNRLNKYPPDHFDYVVIDECHRSYARSYRKIVDHFGSARVIGLTATPMRSDEASLGNVFQKEAYSFPLMPAIDQGWLVPFRPGTIEVNSLDFSNVGSTREDFKPGELSAVLTREENLHKMLYPAVEFVGRRPTIVFAVDVKHAIAIHGVLSRYAPGRCACLHQKTPRDVRKEVLRRFKAGAVQFLINVELFIEGLDIPSVSAIVLARSTKSIGRFLQMIGRGSRTQDGLLDDLGHADPWRRKAAIESSEKPDCLILDYAGNCGRHRLTSVYDALAGKRIDDRTLARAKRIESEKKGKVTASEALDMALAAQALWEEEQERLRHVRASGGNWSWNEMDPSQMGGKVSGILPPEQRCTEKQAWATYYHMGGKYPIDVIRTWSKKKCGGILGGYRKAGG